MKYVDFIDTEDQSVALSLMANDWHLAGISRSRDRWIYLLGRELLPELEWNPETRSYEDGSNHGRGLSGSKPDSRGD